MVLDNAIRKRRLFSQVAEEIFINEENSILRGNNFLLSSLEERVELLEYQVETLSQILNDPKHSHFYQLILERKLSRADVNKIYGLMDMLSENPTSVDQDDYLEKVSELVPKFRGDPTFASSILTALNADGKYKNVYEFLKFNDTSLGIV